MSQWNKVTPAKPCAVCGKCDWCLVSPDGQVSLCNRIESERRCKTGWLHGAHVKTAAPRQVPRPPPGPSFDADAWYNAVRHVSKVAKLDIWARTLGVPEWAIDGLGACTQGEVLAFPMYDGVGVVCGIRTRYLDGRKMAVKGSHAGVFLPTFHGDDEPLICEGPTDSAAAMALCFEPIGRPSCTGSEDIVVETCKRFGYSRVTLCADADGPGVAGGKRMADILRAARVQVRLVAPIGHKDLRDWYKAGARRADVDEAWAQTRWV